MYLQSQQELHQLEEQQKRLKANAKVAAETAELKRATAERLKGDVSRARSEKDLREFQAQGSRGKNQHRSVASQSCSLLCCRGTDSHSVDLSDVHGRGELVQPIQSGR